MAEFWVTNITGLKISLKDLGLFIPPKTSINLLAPGYHLTLEQIEISLDSGSLFNKRDKIVRSQKPLIAKKEQMVVATTTRPSLREYPTEVVEEKSLLDEIDATSEENFAQQFSD